MLLFTYKCYVQFLFFIILGDINSNPRNVMWNMLDKIIDNIGKEGIPLRCHRQTLVTIEDLVTYLRTSKIYTFCFLAQRKCAPSLPNLIEQTIIIGKEPFCKYKFHALNEKA
jgi:hypothetical protein